jgi:hypothetical protein
LAAGLGACATWDNPTALSDLNPDVEFEISVARVETFEDVEIAVHISDNGAPIEMHRSQLQIQHASGSDPEVVDMEPDEHGYAAHVRFFEEGEYHLHFLGIPKGHAIMAEIGQHDIEVHNQHRLVGPYWVELEIASAPILENTTAHVSVLVYDVGTDGLPADLVTGLDVEMAIHAPDDSETALSVQEENIGEYDGEFAFGAAGVYELHVEILVGADHEEGEFHIPVMTESGDTGDDHGGPGHGH